MRSPELESVVIRPARLGDEMNVAGVHVRAWQVGYRTLMPEAYLSSLRLEDRAKRYSFGNADTCQPQSWVAEDSGDSGTVVGFATIGPAQGDEGQSLGELNALYVDPEYWGCCIGAALESAGRAALVKLGYRKAMLWVLAGNERAIGFYEARGWKGDGTLREAAVWGITVSERRFVRALDAGANLPPVQ
jgi:GNAT superfamily N-acetyltransferase